jgi:GNAT superfamily N-acetyltransferase
VTIRRATLEDLPAIVAMAARFRGTTAYAGLVDENLEQLEQLARFLIEFGVVFVAEKFGRVLVGMLGATLVTHPIGGERIASEVAWWVEPEYRGGTAGVRLLEAAETWATTQGARRFQMIAPTANARVGELYRRRGYCEVETTWQRELA